MILAEQISNSSDICRHFCSKPADRIHGIRVSVGRSLCRCVIVSLRWKKGGFNEVCENKVI